MIYEFYFIKLQFIYLKKKKKKKNMLKAIQWFTKVFKRL